MWVYQEQQNLPALSAGADAPEPVEPGLVPECSAPVAETLPAEPIIEGPGSHLLDVACCVLRHGNDLRRGVSRADLQTPR